MVRYSEWVDLGDFSSVDSIDVEPGEYEEAGLRLSCSIVDDLPRLTFSLPGPLERDYVDQYTSFTEIRWQVDSDPWQETNRASYRSSDYFSSVTLSRRYIYSATLSPTGPSRTAFQQMLDDITQGDTLQATFYPLSGTGPEEQTFTFPITGAQEEYDKLECAS